MEPVAQVELSDAAMLAAAAVIGFGAILLTALLLRSRRRRRAALDATLARSREEIDSLSRKVAELSTEVDRARQETARDREYVITSLGDGERPEAGTGLLPASVRPPVGRLVEDRLVEALARRPGASAVPAGVVDLVVRTVALGHGLRRALSPDVLDRAVAEAQVARRRSRRSRRREVREARRLVRAVDPHGDRQGRDVA